MLNEFKKNHVNSSCIHLVLMQNFFEDNLISL